jgi:hypothetical protein
MRPPPNPEILVVVVRLAYAATQSQYPETAISVHLPV